MRFFWWVAKEEGYPMSTSSENDWICLSGQFKLGGLLQVDASVLLWGLQ
jgi:hypothetical protein